MGRLFVRFPRAVFGENLQPCHQHHVDGVIIAVGLIDNHFAPGRRHRDKILVLHGQTPAVGKVDEERPKRIDVD